MPAPTIEGVVPWPVADAARFRDAGYWLDQPLWTPIWERARIGPDRVAVIDGERSLTYEELVDRADAAAARLLDLGIRSDDRMLVQLPNCAEFIVFTLACFRIGAIPVMALPAHRQHELLYLAELSESVAVVVPDVLRDFDHQKLGEQIEREVESVSRVFVLGESVHPGNVSLQALVSESQNLEADRAKVEAVTVPPEQVACFLLSGGTTGLPKLIARTHNDYAYNVRVTSATAGIDESSVYLITLPVSHNFPLACPGILGVLFVGGTVVSLASPEPERAFAAIGAHGVTHCAAVPAVVQRWIEYEQTRPSGRLGTLRVVQVGGSRLVDELAAKVGPVLGATLQQVFGMAEGLINTTRLDDPVEVIVGTQGRPVSEADEIRVIDEHGNDVPPGAEGVLLTRGPYTPRGYYRAPEHNRKSFTDDGWYITGDIVSMTPEGNLIVQGRDKDMINRGGEKISGEEVENLIYRHDGVDLAAAVAMPDPLLGERVCVYVTLKSGYSLTLTQVREAMEAAGVARYKHPERLEVVDQLPLTKVGKIDKKALREDVTARLVV